MEPKPASPQSASSPPPAKKGATPAAPKHAAPKPAAAPAAKPAAATKSAGVKKAADVPAPAPAPRQKTKPAPKPPEPGAWRKWALGAGLLVLVAAVGYGLYSWIGSDSPETASAQHKKKGKKGKLPARPQQARQAEAKPANAHNPRPGTPAPGTLPDRKPGGKTAPAPYVPLVVPKSKDVVIPLTLARLATEYAADPAATNRKYHATILEVSGRYGKQEQRVTGNRPSRAHVLFRTEGRALACDLEASPTDASQWNRLKPGDPITVRGVFNNKDFCLHECRLLPYQPPAEVHYRGKKVELVGLVRDVKNYDEFPALRFERSDTDARVDVVCLFPKTERGKVQSVQVGTTVTVQGMCSGRTGDLVRMDNCHLVDTTAPEPPIERVEIQRFLHEYEEDLLLVLRPVVDEESALDVTLEQLGTELKADPKSIDKKYRHRVLNVSGLLRQKMPLSSTVVLETGKTDQVVKVHCVFTPRNFMTLPEQATYRIRGVCTGTINATTLRLDNCELADGTRKKDLRRLTADFLPHVPGQNLTYDLAGLSARGNREVIRQVFYQREDGLIETLTYYLGTLTNPLFDEKAGDSWTHRRGAKRLRTPLPGLVYRHRIHNGFVEIGLVQPSADGKGTTKVWEPVLKLGATQGTTWKWTHDNLSHTYQVLELPEQGDRLVILETVRSPTVLLPVEVRHVYVRNVGEVERRKWRYISTRDKKLLMEQKLVEEREPVAPPPRKQGKPTPPPAKKPS